MWYTECRAYRALRVLGGTIGCTGFTGERVDGFRD